MVKGLTEGGVYRVDIATTDGKNMFIAAYDVDSPESLLIEIGDEEKKEQILKQFDGSLETLADSLQVISKRLVLLNPKFTRRGSQGN